LISNASPLITIAKIGLLKELLQIYSLIEISPQVFKEIIENGIKNNKTDALLLNGLYKDNKIKIVFFDKKYSKLSKLLVKKYNIDLGEAETIVLAMQLKNEYILIDESLGRNTAKLLGIKTKGTLRFLLELYQAGIINKIRIKSLVEELLGKNFRLDIEVLAKFWELFESMKKRK